MAKCIIDGREAEFNPGEKLIEVAKKVGIEIPYFCYHPGLTVVAQCRICAVEIEKMGKLQTACSTPATEGMVVHTKSEKVKKNQKSVMEFLLINHPLDCPICDKSGECDLQDNSYKYGEATMRTSEDRRTYVDLDMGPVIKKNMNRCIHCTRCIRFGDEVAGIHEMVAVQRGNNTEITTVDGRPLETEYAGCYSDICPTGSLTLKDFRFKKRAWYLKKTPTICDGCSRGCNIEIQQDGNVIYRMIPRENKDVNQYWMCDEGRFGYHFVNDLNRVSKPVVQTQEVSWSEAISALQSELKSQKVTVFVGSDLTQEDAQSILKFVEQNVSGTNVYHFGTKGVASASEDAPADKLLKRKSKTGNLHGLEKLGIKPLSSSAAKGTLGIIFNSGRADIQFLKSEVKNINQWILVGVTKKDQVSGFKAILPSLSFAEKNGTILNFEGREQLLKRALVPVGGSKAIPEILMLAANQSSLAPNSPTNSKTQNVAKEAI